VRDEAAGRTTKRFPFKNATLPGPCILKRDSTKNQKLTALDDLALVCGSLLASK
jgi:hypothetical protein